MRTESEPFDAEGEINPETGVKVFELGQAPGFFIPFSLDPNSPKLEQGLSKLINIHNALLAENIPVFWRSFGFNGYLTNNEDYGNFIRILDEYKMLRVLLGLPLGDGSFIIRFSPPGFPELNFYNLGSPAIVAAYKGNACQLDNPYNVIKIGAAENSFFDYKQTPLQIMAESDLLEHLFRLENQAQQNPNIFDQLKLSPFSPDIDQINLPSAFVLKIDVNDSTRTKINNGDWLRTEIEHSSFMGEFLLKTGCLPQIHLIDPIGESILIICNNPSLISPIYESLKSALHTFPNITVKAVGKKLPNVTLYLSNNIPIFYAPYIEEKDWYLLEQKYKDQHYKEKPGSFLISS